MILVLKCIIALILCGEVATQACTSISQTLNGTWTSTNFGTITISSSALRLSMTKTLVGTTGGSHFTCLFQSDTKYVFKLNQTKTFSISGINIVLNIYGCFDFKEASPNAFYYYLLSEEEVLLSSQRFKLITTTSSVFMSNVCDSSLVLDTAQFHTMVRTGHENEAISAVKCPEALSAAVFRYTYTDQSGTYCTNVNTSSVSYCNITHDYDELIINNTGCTNKDPFYSANGVVGCLLNVYDSATDTYFTSYYNKDSPFSQVTGLYYRFTCVAMQKTKTGTLYLSLLPTDCVAGQTATTASSSGGITGATMILTPTYSCIPPTTEKTEHKTWLIVLLVPIGVLIMVVIIIIIIYCKCKALEKKKAREKGILISEDHPLGEMSIALDAPATMERIPNGFIDANELMISARTPKKKGDLMNPMAESSMNLNFRKPSWASLSPRKSQPSLQLDPFSEMDSGIVMPISEEGSKTTRTLKTPTRQKSFLYNGTPKTGTPKTGKVTMNGDAGQVLAITDGRTPYPLADTPDFPESRMLKSEKSFSKETFARSQSVYAPSVKALSTRALSVRAPSVKNDNGAPSVAALSVKSAHTHKAPSTATSKSDKRRPKMVRSVTSTKIGSITRRAAGTPKRKKKISRSKTMILPQENHDPEEGGMAEFMNAEVQDWGSQSEAARSRRSSRTAKTAKSTKTTPRKSIQPKMTGIPNYFKAISVS